MFFESTSLARRLGISVTYLHLLTAKIGLQIERTHGGRRLYSDEDIAALERYRAEQVRDRLPDRRA